MSAVDDGDPLGHGSAHVRGSPPWTEGSVLQTQIRSALSLNRIRVAGDSVVLRYGV
jgi:hypothetical protein